MHYLIRSSRGHYWQTARGFYSKSPEGERRAHTISDATKYDSESEAAAVIGFCVNDSGVSIEKALS